MLQETLRTISIDQLRVGMFVTKLDISWLDSPFLTNTRLIKDSADLSALRKAGAKTVVIDIHKGCVPLEDDPPLTGSVAKSAAKDVTVAPACESAPKRQPVVSDSITKVSLQQELTAAMVIRSKIKKAVEQLQASFESERPVAVEELTPLVDHTLSSLERNDQALMSLVHLSRKSQKLAEHTFGTFCLVLNLALIRGVNEEQREQLGLAALLHEAGWTQLPLNLMGKRTRYSPAELALVEKHTQLGAKILNSSKLPDLTRRIIDEHHELLDGSGYPKRLSGQQLHPLTGILSVVDAYEERVHQLTDMPGMVANSAIRALYQEAEKGRYSTEVVAAFIGMLGIYPVGSAVLLNTQEKALVQEFHPDNPLCPTLRIIYDRNGHLVSECLTVDLRDQRESAEQRNIEGVLDPASPQVDPYRRLQLSEDNLP